MGLVAVSRVFRQRREAAARRSAHGAHRVLEAHELGVALWGGADVSLERIAPEDYAGDVGLRFGVPTKPVTSTPATFGRGRKPRVRERDRIPIGADHALLAPRPLALFLKTMSHQIPSPKLLSAAFLGLFASSVPSCTDADESSTQEGRRSVSGADSGTVADAAVLDAAPDSGDASADGGAEAQDEKIIGEPLEQVFGFQELKLRCDERGGYIQVHAICGSTNSCAGFSYYDGDGPKTYFEHSCSGANWCKGFTCVELPEDSGKDGRSIYVDACTGCHSGGEEEPSSFTVYVEPGAPRLQASWPDREVAAQQTITAFGMNAVAKSGTYYANMPPFFKEYSRAEIERVVEFVRSLTGEYVEYIEYKP
jgi:hypothetical protein